MGEHVDHMRAAQNLAQRITHCTRCPLHEGRTHAVVGFGPLDARVMLIGEAPGRSEDEQGKPFVGASGRYLDELLERAGLVRDEVYIANVLKCRPPSNRNPKFYEIEQCSDYLREQVALIRPDYLVTLGNFATKFILKTDQGITDVHGKVYTMGEFKVLPVFHPAAAIYDRTKRPLLEHDFDYLATLLASSL